jgi:hypothetical protein
MKMGKPDEERGIEVGGERNRLYISST